MSTVSTTVNEVIVTGRKKRRLIDRAAKLWQRISYWTKACDVEFDDGKTAQEKVGAINGITSNFNEGSSDIAASSLLTKKIKDDLNEGIINSHIQLVILPDGTLGWKKDGADTALPFNSFRRENIYTGDIWMSSKNNTKINTGGKKPKIVFVWDDNFSGWTTALIDFYDTVSGYRFCYGYHIQNSGDESSVSTNTSGITILDDGFSWRRTYGESDDTGFLHSGHYWAIV